MLQTTLRVMVVAPEESRAATILNGLSEAGYVRVSLLRSFGQLLRDIVEADPELIVMDLGSSGPAQLQEAFRVSSCVHRPVAMFVDRSDALTIDAAVAAGVASYVVDGLKKERVAAVAYIAMSRFQAFARLRDERNEARQALEERKVIDRAKGILMKERSLDEAAAYDVMRKAAMNENRRIGEVAQSLVTAAGVWR